MFIDGRREKPTRGERRDQPWTHRFIHDFAGHFPNLEHLHISHVNWRSDPPHPSVHMAISRFASMRKLVLQGCDLPSWHMLRRIITALSSSLTSLALWDVTCPVTGEGVKVLLHPAASALSEFTFSRRLNDGNCLEPFMRWLSHTPTRSSLRRLLFSQRHGLTTEETAFLTSIAPGLSELQYDSTLR